MSGFNSVTIKGGNCSTSTKMELFDNESQRVSFVFGRNGSGKSTIARALKNIDRCILDEPIAINFFNEKNEIIQKKFKRTMVFDEEFIAENIKIKGSHLGAIVMLGEQVDVSDQISQAEEAIETSELAIQQLQVSIDEENDVGKHGSMLYFRKEIEKVLKKPGGWAYRKGMEIGRNKINAKVIFEEVVRNIFSKDHDKTEAEIRECYRQKLNEYNEILKYGAKITQSIPDHFVPEDYSDSVLRDLLAVKLNKPDLSKYESRIIKEIESHMESLQKTQQLMKSDAVQVCPLCFQAITEQHKHQMLNLINDLFNEEAEVHIDQLRSKKITIPDIDISALEDRLDRGVLEKYRGSIDRLKGETDTINQLIDRKISNPYAPVYTNEVNLRPLIDASKDAADELIKHLNKYNNMFDHAEEIKGDLEVLNDKVAYYEVIALYKSYKSRAAMLRKYSDQKKIEETKINSLKDQILKLREKVKSKAIASDLINKYLGIVFCSKSRMRLKMGEDGYGVCVNGAKVNPENLSVGERNVIALCYFFALLRENLGVRSGFCRETLMVLDDPISSFDNENKIGVISLVAIVLNEFLIGNEANRVIVLLHDLHGYMLLTSAFTQKGMNRNSVSTKELKNGKLENFSITKGNEYSVLLNTVFKYLKDDDGSLDLLIGNVSRRLLEAFSTFFFNMGIWNLIGGKEISKYLTPSGVDVLRSSILYKLLNVFSHSEETIRLIDEQYDLPLISHEDKKRVAKETLVLMYLINAEHVVKHLVSKSRKEHREGGDEEEIRKTFSIWIEDLQFEEKKDVIN